MSSITRSPSYNLIDSHCASRFVSSQRRVPKMNNKNLLSSQSQNNCLLLPFRSPASPQKPLSNHRLCNPKNDYYNQTQPTFNVQISNPTVKTVVYALIASICLVFVALNIKFRLENSISFHREHKKDPTKLFIPSAQDASPPRSIPGVQNVEDDQTDSVDPVNPTDQTSQQKSDPIHSLLLYLSNNANNTLNASSTIDQRLFFTNKTTLNFFHLHKTGGTTMKSLLYKYFHQTHKGDGHNVTMQGSCYALTNETSGVLSWRCDWDVIEKMTSEQRQQVDVTVGHQFLIHGITDLLKERDVKTFTILRHPFDRKLSFFFHFFVRALNRNESDVQWEEIRDFLIYNIVQCDADLGRDAGPNYIAGRMLSNGIDGFVGDYTSGYFKVDENDKELAVQIAKSLLGRFVFVGLQNERNGTSCLLQKTLQAFDEAHGITDSFRAVFSTKRTQSQNNGNYELSASEAWLKLTDDEREEFERKEYIDLSIYREAEALFQAQVRSFACEEIA